jgi:hypothetical protein
MTQKEKLNRISDNFKRLNRIRAIKNEARDEPEMPLLFEHFNHISYLDLLHLEKGILRQIDFL